LKKENAELRRATEILKSASAFFASRPGWTREPIGAVATHVGMREMTPW